MSDFLARLLSDEVVKTQDDMTATSSGGSFVRELPIAKVGFGRLSGYVEVGIHEHGKAPHRKPKPLARFSITLLSKHHFFNIGKEETLKSVPHVMHLTLPISTNESSDYIKVFQAMNWDQKARHPIQLLNKPFKIAVTHTMNPETKKPQYANLWKGSVKDKIWSFSAPVIEDPETGEKTSIANKVPPLPNGVADISAFLFSNPCQESFDSLFIEGTRDVKGKDGVVRTVTKNFIQEQIMTALNFAGSEVEALIGGMGELPSLEEPEAAVKETPVSGKSEEEAAAEALEKAANDSLAALGL